MSTDGTKFYLTALFYKEVENIESTYLKLIILNKKNNAWSIDKIEALQMLSSFSSSGHASSFSGQQLSYTWLVVTAKSMTLYSQSYDVVNNIFSDVETIIKTSKDTDLSVKVVSTDKSYAVHYSVGNYGFGEYLEKISICKYDDRLGCRWESVLDESRPQDSTSLFSSDEAYVVFTSSDEETTFNYIFYENNKWASSKKYFSESSARINNIGIEGNKFYVDLTCQRSSFESDLCVNDNLITLEILNNEMTEIESKSLSKNVVPSMFVRDGKVNTISVVYDSNEFPQYNVVVTNEDDLSNPVRLLNEPYSTTSENYWDNA